MTQKTEWAGIAFNALGLRDGRMLRAPGLFAFVRYDAADGPLMLLADQGEDMAQAAGPGHPFWTEALSLGMNELHVSFPVPRRVDRLQLLARIVRHVQPVLNVIDAACPAPLAPPADRRAG